MKVIALRNFAYGFGMVYTGEELDLSEPQAASLVETGFAAVVEEKEPDFRDMKIKSKSKKK